jgi:soluble lytic murein transglycosylase-like protein
MQRLMFVGFWALIQGAAQTAPTAMSAATPAAEASIRARMESALEKQRVSVRRQIAGAVPVPEAAAAAWFTVPWEPVVAQSAGEPPPCAALPTDQINEMIEKTAVGQRVSATLLREVMRQESAFVPCAVSSKGASGLMQLMPQTAADFGVADVFNPQENLEAGAKYLATLLEKYKGDQRLALAAYNAGSERVTQYRGVPPFPETENYVREILGRLANISQSKD